MRLSEHSFVIDSAPVDLVACPGCGQPNHFCVCDVEEDDLPTYRGADLELYKEKFNGKQAA